MCSIWRKYLKIFKKLVGSESLPKTLINSANLSPKKRSILRSEFTILLILGFPLIGFSLFLFMRAFEQGSTVKTYRVTLYNYVRNRTDYTLMALTTKGEYEELVQKLRQEGWGKAEGKGLTSSELLDLSVYLHRYPEVSKQVGDSWGLKLSDRAKAISWLEDRRVSNAPGTFVLAWLFGGLGLFLLLLGFSG